MQYFGMVRRSFKHMNSQSFIALYRAYTRPHLGICVQAWSISLPKYIDSLEKVQHRATKLVPNIAKLAYDERLRYIGLYSLYGRRQRGDLIETYKILNGWDHVEAGHFFQESSQLGRTREHTKKIFKQRARLQIRHRFFLLRVIDQWNGLP